MRIPSLGARALPVARQRVPPRRRPVKRGPELQTGPPRKERLFAPETETTKGGRFQTKAHPRWTGPREFRGRCRDTPRSSRRRHHGAQLSPRLRSHPEEETVVPSRTKIHVIACRRISSRGVRVTVLRFRGVPGLFSRRIHLAYSAVGPGSVSVYFLVRLTSFPGFSRHYVISWRNTWTAFTARPPHRATPWDTTPDVELGLIRRAAF